MAEIIVVDSCGDSVGSRSNGFILSAIESDKWGSPFASMSTANTSTAEGRNGGTAYSFAAGSRGVRKHTDIPCAGAVVGFASIYNSSNGAFANTIGFGYADTQGMGYHIVVGATVAGQVFIARNAAGENPRNFSEVIAESDAGVFDPFVWHHFAARCVVGVNGSVEVQVNTHTVLQFHGNTFGDAGGLINEWSIGFADGGTSLSSTVSRRIDDIYINRLDDPEEDGFLGNVYVGADTPATTVQAQGTPSDPEANNHEMVNEFGSGAPDEDTTHVALEQGQKDRYGFGPLPTNGKIHAVQLTARYRSQDGGLPQVKLSIESGGQEVSKTDTPEANQEYRYKNTVIANTDPATNEQWTQQAVNDMTAGIEVLDD